MTNSIRSHVALFINGRRHAVSGAQAFMMLADYLRYVCHLTGTKIVCAEGDCGACTVLCYRYDEVSDRFVPINSCIAILAELDGCHIVTVEGLKDEAKLSPVQQAIVECHGSQCGYCTPGFVMAMTAIFEKPCQNLSEQKVKNCLTGNLCRCTGYQPLIEAALSIDAMTIKPQTMHYPKQDADELFEARQLPLHVIDNDQDFYAPLTLDEAFKWRMAHHDGRVIAGATDLGVLLNKSKIKPQNYLSLHLIKGLNKIEEEDDHIVIGACATLTNIRAFLKTCIPQFADFLNLFASPQIKNMATMVGNVANGSPIADTVPFLMVVDGAVLTLGETGKRTVRITDLYVGYKKLALLPGEIITGIRFRKPKASEFLRLEKVSQRKDLDISTINMAMLFDFDNARVIKDARIAVGGVFSSVIRLKRVEHSLKSKTLSRETIDDASSLIQSEIAPLDDLRASNTYRRMLVDGLFRHYCHGVMA